VLLQQLLLQRLPLLPWGWLAWPALICALFSLCNQGRHLPAQTQRSALALHLLPCLEMLLYDAQLHCQSLG
jgi:hypothetical protein